MPKSPRTVTAEVSPVPIMVRALLTPGEWLELRRLALLRGTTTQSLVGAALRATYPLTPKETTEHGQ